MVVFPRSALRSTDTSPQRWTRVVGELKLVDECWMKQVGGNTRTNKLFNNLKTMHAALAAFVITECEKRAAAAGRPFAPREV